MGHEIGLNSWEEFEGEITRLERKNGTSLQPLLYRGQSDCRWLLSATLERHDPKYSVEAYYRLLLRTKPAVESLTKTHWKIPDYYEVKKFTRDYDTFRTLPSYDYLAHVRHQGFLVCPLRSGPP